MAIRQIPASWIQEALWCCKQFLAPRREILEGWNLLKVVPKKEEEKIKSVWETLDDFSTSLEGGGRGILIDSDLF